MRWKGPRTRCQTLYKMAKRKAAKSSPDSRIGPRQKKATHKLRQLSEHEARAVYDSAKKEKKLYGQMNLRDSWRRWRYGHSLTAFIADLRDLIKDPSLDDPSLVPGNLARFIELM